MALIDAWGTPLVESGMGDGAIMPLEEFVAAKQAGAVLPWPTGVRLPPQTNPETIAAWLATVALVCVEFPKFRDGRGFTLARTLRERYRFEGDIRAVGHLLPDQLDALRRCGFSSVLTPPGHPPGQWARPTLASGGRERSSVQLLNRLVAGKAS